MCTFLLQNGALWNICLVHCGTRETDLLLYLTTDVPYACRIKAPLSSVMRADGVTGHCQSASRKLMYMHIHHWRPRLYQTVTQRVIPIINAISHITKGGSVGSVGSIWP